MRELEVSEKSVDARQLLRRLVHTRRISVQIYVKQGERLQIYKHTRLKTKRQRLWNICLCTWVDMHVSSDQATTESKRRDHSMKFETAKKDIDQSH